VDNLNLVISFCFLVEMLVKIIGLGIKEYSRDKFNLFDAFVVCISMVDFIIIQSVG
jgi:Ion transport protein